MEIDAHVKELLSSITAEDANKIKEDLIGLYQRELLERDLYFQELRKFDGSIFETVKWLEEQEITHAHILESILSRAQIIPQEEKHNFTKILREEKNQILKMNVAYEAKAVQAYSAAIQKSSGALKEILTGIMSEELLHIERLKEFIKGK